MEIGRVYLRAKCVFTALCVLVNVKGLLIVGAGMPRLCTYTAFKEWVFRVVVCLRIRRESWGAGCRKETKRQVIKL